MPQARIHRREMLKRLGLGGAGLLILPGAAARGYQANERMSVAIIGVGGRGSWFVNTMPGMANVVGLCDVNDSKAGQAYEKIPAAKKYYDYRRMLEELDKQIEGVIIAAPDHIHAPAASMAMKMGKHVLCEKPLTHSVQESRYLRELARKTGVATQMGNQGTASEAFRRATELIQAGVIGQVREVYAWNNSGGAGPRPVPDEEWKVPDYLKWDLWLGPAPHREYHPDWLRWRSWRDFGTAVLGNWAVHTMNLAFKALRLDAMWYPDQYADAQPAGKTFTIHANASEVLQDNFPRWEMIDYTFPARGKLPGVVMHWINGGRAPDGRDTIESHLGRKLDWGDAGDRKWRDHAGLLILGDKGKVHTTGHNAEMTLMPEDQFKDFDGPAKTLPRSRGHEREWLIAAAGGERAWSNFDYAAPLTELVLLGNVATRVEGPIEYDAVACKVVNNDFADAALKRESYRKGWEL